MIESVIKLEAFADNVEVYFVQSQSLWKVKYAVTLSNTGSWSCSCPDFMYRHPIGGCKHIALAQYYREKNGGSGIPSKPTRFSAMDV